MSGKLARVDVLRYVPLGPLLAAVVLGCAIAAMAAVLAGRRRGGRAALNAAIRVLLIGSVLVVIGLTQVGSHSTGGINLVPTGGIRQELGNPNRTLGAVNIVGNVMLFVPLGFLAPSALRWRTGTITAAGALLSVAIETLQIATGRSGDIDDVLLNTLGAWLGAVAGAALARILRNHFTAATSGVRPQDEPLSEAVRTETGGWGEVVVGTVSLMETEARPAVNTA